MNRKADWEQTNLFNGKGTVSIWNLLNKDAPPFSAALWCQLEPLGSVGNHRQQRDPEIILCIRGQGDIRIDGVVSILSPGTLRYVPFGSVLAIRNTSAEEALVYVIVKAKM